MISEASNGTWSGRAIMLLDLDAFFASVEQLDHPAWRGRPVIVGGKADARGVVSTCSYEARSYGVRSAMPAATAAKLCPHAIWTSGNFARYREISSRVMDIMRSKSPLIQQVSIDEAFLDISPTRFQKTDPVAIAMDIQEAVAQLGVSASIGLGVSKAVAKIASDMDKPHGLTIVYPGREQDFLSKLPTSRMSGIGPVAQEALKNYGIHTLGQVATAKEEILHVVFGKNAHMMRLRCLGADTDPVLDTEDAKSISNEMSFAENVYERHEIEAAVHTVAAKVGRRLRMKGLYASGIVLKVRYDNLRSKSASAKLRVPTNNEYDFIDSLCNLLDDVWTDGMQLRLIGAAAIHLSDSQKGQMALFSPEEQEHESRIQNTKRKQLTLTTDAIKNRFGEEALLYGSEMRTHENLTGSSSKNPADYK